MDSRIERSLARGVAVQNHLRRGVRTFVVMSDGRVEAIDRGVGRVWACEAGAPNLARPARTAIGDDCLLWSDARGELLVHLCESVNGVAIRGRRGSDGHLLWERDAPSVWEHVPGWPTNAILMMGSEADRCLLASVRKRVGRPGVGVANLEPRTGAVVFAHAYGDASIDPDPEPCFLGVFLRGAAVHVLLEDGSTRALFECPGRPASPLVLGEAVFCAWRTGRRLGAAQVNRRTGAVLARCEWPRRGVDVPGLIELDGRVLLQVTEQHYSLLSESMTPLWEARLPHWFRDAAFRSDGALVIETSGRTVVLDAETGAEIARSRF